MHSTNMWLHSVGLQNMDIFTCTLHCVPLSSIVGEKLVFWEIPCSHSGVDTDSIFSNMMPGLANTEFLISILSMAEWGPSSITVWQLMSPLYGT
jgi:hypothetical protein